MNSPVRRVPFVGLTGGLGAGKSEALRALSELGAATLSTDEVAHELLAGELHDEVVERLGPEVAPGGAIDRSLVAGAVFGDDEARAWLEGLLWPRVGARVLEWRERARRRRSRSAVRRWSRCRCCSSRGWRRCSTARSRWSPTRASASGAPAPAGTRAWRRARGTAAFAGGKGAASGLHRAQRRHARGVEAGVVTRTCKTRGQTRELGHRTPPDPVRPQAPVARRGAAPAAGRRGGGCPAPGGARRRRGDRQRPAGRGRAGDHPAAPARRHHPPAVRRQATRPGAGGRGDLRGVEVPRPDLARGRARA